MDDSGYEQLTEMVREEISLALNNKGEINFYTKFNTLTCLDKLLELLSKKICEKAA